MADIKARLKNIIASHKQKRAMKKLTKLERKQDIKAANKDIYMRYREYDETADEEIAKYDKGIDRELNPRLHAVRTNRAIGKNRLNELARGTGWKNPANYKKK